MTHFQGACETGDAVLGLFLRSYDLAYRWLHGLTDPRAEVGPALRIEVRRYRGPAVALADGTEVRRGDRIGVIHFNNEYMARLHGDGSETPWAGLKARRAFLASLRALARQVVETDRYAGVQAFMAETIFHRQMDLAGFEIRPLPRSTPGWIVAAYERALLAYYHPLGRRRTKRLLARQARAIWISRKALLRRYGAERSAPSETGA